ncbi:hypothetical protein M422DRAFT_266712 [Sphaerobolus stellatus SS14]|uniref:Uncharacterized protein n=1 Tax=Sphaerobolus stellatus (strain SS14) TaxID=990650 RepID=A0A0C9UAK5_SPHS4|nr:hypothetical protein M422DRAFT_266712 [Sphaerobolus stellatus SS14]
MTAPFLIWFFFMVNVQVWKNCDKLASGGDDRYEARAVSAAAIFVDCSRAQSAQESQTDTNSDQPYSLSMSGRPRQNRFAGLQVATSPSPAISGSPPQPAPESALLQTLLTPHTWQLPLGTPSTQTYPGWSETPTRAPQYQLQSQPASAPIMGALSSTLVPPPHPAPTPPPYQGNKHMHNVDEQGEQAPREAQHQYPAQGQAPPKVVLESTYRQKKKKKKNIKLTSLAINIENSFGDDAAALAPATAVEGEGEIDEDKQILWGRRMGRIIDPYSPPSHIFAAGLEYEPDENSDADLLPIPTEHQHLVVSLTKLLNYIPQLDSYLSQASKIPDVMKQQELMEELYENLHKGQNFACTDDTRAICVNVIKILFLLFPARATGLDIDVKDNRGFKHELTHEHLASIEFDLDDPTYVVVNDLISEVITPEPTQFPRLVYENLQYDPDDMFTGFLRNPLLIKAFLLEREQSQKGECPPIQGELMQAEQSNWTFNCLFYDFAMRPISARALMPPFFGRLPEYLMIPSMRNLQRNSWNDGTKPDSQTPKDNMGRLFAQLLNKKKDAVALQDKTNERDTQGGGHTGDAEVEAVSGDNASEAAGSFAIDPALL